MANSVLSSIHWLGFVIAGILEIVLLVFIIIQFSLTKLVLILFALLFHLFGFFGVRRTWCGGARIPWLGSFISFLLLVVLLVFLIITFSLVTFLLDLFAILVMGFSVYGFHRSLEDSEQKDFNRTHQGYAPVAAQQPRTSVSAPAPPKTGASAQMGGSGQNKKLPQPV